MIKLSAQELKNETRIAPEAIPVSKEIIQLTGLNTDQLEIADNALKFSEHLICTPENFPKELSPQVDLDNLKISDTDKLSISTDTMRIHKLPPVAMRENGLLTPEENLNTKLALEDGIHDTHRLQTFLAALFTLMFAVSILGAIVCTVLLVLNKEQTLYIFGPGIAALFAIIYFTTVQQKRCCICHQKQFTKGRNRKKGKGHYSPIFGYVIPTSLNIIFKGWFNCMICGSRIKIWKK